MNKTLKTVEQKTVAFYDDELIAIKGDDGQIYVSIRHLCEAIGVARQGQMRRIKDDEILSEGYRGGNILLPPGPGGGRQNAALIRVDLVPLWLSGLRVKAVKEEIRPKLKKYKQEAAKVLWEAFQEGRLTADPIFDELLQTETDAVQAYKLLQALTKLARNQILLEAQLDTHSTQLTDHEQRLEQVEITLGDKARYVMPEQASQISQAVKAVAIQLGKKSGRNEFGGVYGELYRRFDITSYKMLPAKRFEEAMTWLNEWYQTLAGREIPF